MPELPEVETVVRTLRPRLLEQKLLHLETFRPEVAEDAGRLRELPATLYGGTITHVERIGKFICLTVRSVSGTDYLMFFHLRMTGTLLYHQDWQQLAEKARFYATLRFDLTNGSLLFSDVRRFGTFDYLPLSSYAQDKRFAKLGPDALDPAGVELYLRNLRKVNRYQSIKALLLRQDLISGIGNIYASESLFASKLSPLNTVGVLTEAHLRTIYENNRLIMLESIAYGGTSISDYLDGDGKRGTYQNFLKVYEQTYCPDCGRELVKYELAGRGTYACINCQARFWPSGESGEFSLM